MGSGAFAVSIMSLVVKLRVKLADYVDRKYKIQFIILKGISYKIIFMELT